MPEAGVATSRMLPSWK